MTVVAIAAIPFLSSARCVSLLLGAFMLMELGLAQGQTTERCAKVPAETPKALYSLACSGKSECGATDTLSVAPASSTTPAIAVMCLDFGGGWLEWLPAATSDKPPQPPLSYPLAPLVARALGEGRAGNARVRLAAAPGGRLPMDVVVADTAGGNFREHLLFDTTSLWSSGQLSLEPVALDCKPCRFDGTLRLSVPELASWRRATNADLTKLQLILNGTRMPGLEVLADLADDRGTHDQRIWFSSFNGTSWTPQQFVSGVATSCGVSLAVFGGKLYMAWKGMLSDQLIWWSSFDGSTWAPQQTIAGVATSVGPQLAVFQGSLYAIWKGMNNDQGLWYSHFNGSAWVPQKQVPGVGTSEGASIAVFNNKLWAAWKGMNDDQRLWYSSFDGTSWAAQTLISGVGTSWAPQQQIIGIGTNPFNKHDNTREPALET